MQKLWYVDESSNEKISNRVQFMDVKDLYSLTGVEHRKIDVNNLSNMKELTDLRKTRGYNYEDILEISKEKLAEFNEIADKLYKEHLHEDEEIRLFLDGGGYFDFRDKNDKWIRIKAEKDDLLILPPGIYHRFSLDDRCYAKILRLFSEVPCWKSFNRPADEHPARKKYLKTIAALG